MKKRGLVIAALGAASFAAAVYYAAAFTLRRLGAVVSLFYNNETILSALDRLVLAEVTPPSVAAADMRFYCCGAYIFGFYT